MNRFINRESALFAKLRRRFGAKAQIQPGFLRVESVLTSQRVSQTFNLIASESTRRPQERFVGKNDLVLPYRLKVAVNKVRTKSNGNNGNSIDYTYPDYEVFKAKGTETQLSEVEALESIWNGSISLKSDTFEAYNEMTLKPYRIVPVTQHEVGALHASYNNEGNGFHPLLQPYLFSGQSSIEMDFKHALGTDVSNIGGTSEEENVLSFTFLTLVVRNKAKSLSAYELETGLIDINK